MKPSIFFSAIHVIIICHYAYPFPLLTSFSHNPNYNYHIFPYFGKQCELTTSLNEANKFTPMNGWLRGFTLFRKQIITQKHSQSTDGSSPKVMRWSEIWNILQTQAGVEPDYRSVQPITLVALALECPHLHTHPPTHTHSNRHVALCLSKLLLLHN